jgi:hypothetical protein
MLLVFFGSNFGSSDISAAAAACKCRSEPLTSARPDLLEIERRRHHFVPQA